MISILIPYRATPERERIWQHCSMLWAASGYDVVVGTSPDGPFNTAAAINDAAARATGDTLIVHGADHLPNPGAVEWAVEQLDTHHWVSLYSATAHYDDTATSAILNGYHPDSVPSKTTPDCIADIGIRHDSWIPLDERFTGWGSEDRAWRLTLETLYGPSPVSRYTLRNLYHPPADRDNADTNYQIYLEYEANLHRLSEYLLEHA